MQWNTFTWVAWFTETSSQKIFWSMRTWISNSLTLALLLTKTLKSSLAFMVLKAIWHRRLGKAKSTTENKLTFFQLVSYSSVLWEVYSHFQNHQNLTTGTIYSERANLILTSPSLTVLIVYHLSSKTLSWDSSPTKALRDQLSNKLDCTHGCKSRGMNRSKYVKT